MALLLRVTVTVTHPPPARGDTQATPDSEHGSGGRSWGYTGKRFGALFRKKFQIFNPLPFLVSQLWIHAHRRLRRATHG